MTTWIVVADSSRGKIFVQDKPNGPLVESEDLIHTGARLRESQLRSDRAGREGGAFGQGQSLFDARTEAHAHEAEAFAREIAEHLEAGRTGGKFQHLVLMAPPAFLGDLRGKLSDGVRRLVVGEVGKDLVTHTAEDVRMHLPHAM